MPCVRSGSRARSSGLLALVIPLWGVDGRVVLYQARPDYPRTRDGKPVEYETPSSSSVVLDAHPAAQSDSPIPSRPLVVTEGVRKADSRALGRRRCRSPARRLELARHERRRRQDGAPRLGASRARRAPRVPRVRLGRLTEPAGTCGRAAVRAFLGARGADVRVTRLQPARDGGKQGLDDYLAAGGSLEELLAGAATFAEQQSDLLGQLYTDLGNAHRFVAMHGDSFRYCREERRWLEWRGGRWRRLALVPCESSRLSVRAAPSFRSSI